MTNCRIIVGDAFDELRKMPDNSVHMVVTSPPYFQLRDYGIAGQVGLEETPEEFIDRLVGIFREVRRVLRPDGTLWVNIGDTYASAGGLRRPGGTSQRAGRSNLKEQTKRSSTQPPPDYKPKDLIGIPFMFALAMRRDGWYFRQDIIWHKPNPMPESVDDRCTKSHEYMFLFTKSERYYFDAEAIKEPAAFGVPNAPDVIKSPYGQGYTRRAHNPTPAGWNTGDGHHGTIHPEGRRPSRSGNLERKPRPGAPVGTGKNQAGGVPWEGYMRNKRSVWTVATEPYPEAHFATYPEALISPCILAGTSARGCCPDCDAPWRRMMYLEFVPQQDVSSIRVARLSSQHDPSNRWSGSQHGSNYSQTTGWRPTCQCYDDRYLALPQPRRERKRLQREAWPDRWRRVRARPGRDDWPAVPALVLDPFFGAGTTAMACRSTGRDCVGIELNPKYAAMARRRIRSALGRVDCALDEIVPSLGLFDRIADAAE